MSGSAGHRAFTASSPSGPSPSDAAAPAPSSSSSPSPSGSAGASPSDAAALPVSGSPGASLSGSAGAPSSDAAALPVSGSPRFSPSEPAGPSAAELLAAMTDLPAGHPARPALRERAIEAWVPLARRLASRYCGRGEPADDLVQTAVVGLIKAVDRFDPERGTDFVGYAIPTVVGEIKRYFRDRTWAMRVPRRLQELRLAITAANGRLTQRLGRSPTVADVAADLDLTEEQVLEGLEGAQAYTATSLSTPVGDGGGRELGDLLGGDDHAYDLVDARTALGPALATLDERDQRILALRFYGNHSQAEIAEQIGISQMHVSRLISRALLRLRHEMDLNG
jgi:RNA polymerase sigma-B factor